MVLMRTERRGSSRFPSVFWKLIESALVHDWAVLRPHVTDVSQLALTVARCARFAPLTGNWHTNTHDLPAPWPGNESAGEWEFLDLSLLFPFFFLLPLLPGFPAGFPCWLPLICLTLAVHLAQRLRVVG